MDYSDPGVTPTPNIFIRSEMLYAVELQDQQKDTKCKHFNLIKL